MMLGPEDDSVVGAGVSHDVRTARAINRNGERNFMVFAVKVWVWVWLSLLGSGFYVGVSLFIYGRVDYLEKPIWSSRTVPFSSASNIKQMECMAPAETG